MGHRTLRTRLVLIAVATAVAVLALMPAAASAVTPGSISGTLLDRQTGLPLVNGIVAFSSVDTSGNWNWAGSGVADTNGNYTLGDLLAGNYVANAYDDAVLYEPRYYLDTTDSSLATLIPLADGENSTIATMSLRPYAHLSGHVTRKLTGENLANIQVSACEASGSVWDAVQSTYTDSNGDYSLDYILGGSYHVRFSDPATTPVYADAMYSGIDSYPSPADISLGTTFTVDDGQTTTGINEALVDIALYPFESVPPTTTATVNPAAAGSSWSATTTALVSLTSTDGPSGSGVASIWYALSANGPRVAYTPGNTIPVTAEGTTTVWFGAIDNWNNAETTKTVGVHLDRTAPVPSAQQAPGVGSTTVTLRATDSYSGVSAILYRLDGAGETTYTAPIVVVGLGNHTIAYRAVDNVGNWSSVQSLPVGVQVVPTFTTPALSPTTPKHGKKFKISGHIWPVDASTARVTLYIERKISGKYRAYDHVNVAVALSGKYSVSIKLSKKGSYRVRAYHGVDSIHLAGYSNWRNFAVK